VVVKTDKLPITAKKIAEYLGINQSSVSRALHGKKVSKETIERVQRAASELGYRPNLGARIMATGRTGIYGLLTPGTTNPYMGWVIERSQAKSLEGGHYVALGDYQEDFDEYNRYIELFVHQQLVDGLIIYPMHDARLLDPIGGDLAGNIPIVMIGQCTHPRIHWVRQDHQFGWMQMANHLVELGHRNIGVLLDFLGRGDNAIQLDEDPRYCGFVNALEAANIKWDMANLIKCRSSLESGYSGARELLSRPNPPSAIFASNDLLAMGVLSAAQEMGVSIPEQLSVVGYDNTDFSKFFDLTTVDNLNDEVVVAPIEILNRVTEEGFEKTGKLTRTFRPKIIIRGSTGPVCTAPCVPKAKRKA
jgi:LacI family transcriptional regulator